MKKFEIRRNKELQNEFFIETGKKEEFKTFEVDFEKATKKQRENYQKFEKSYGNGERLRLSYGNYLELDSEKETFFEYIERSLVDIDKKQKEKAKELAEKEAIEKAKTILADLLKSKDDEIKELKSEIKKLKSEIPAKLTKEEKYLVNLGYHEIEFDFDNFIEEDDEGYDDYGSNPLGLKSEIWIDTANENKRIYVVCTENAYYTK